MRLKKLDSELMDKDVHVWVINLVHHHITVNQNILSKQELERAKKFKLHESKRTYLLCRYVLRCLLGIYLNMEPKKLEFEYNLFGKPFLKESIYRDTIHFNLSHCQNVGCITITKTGTVGVDVEKVKSSLLEIIDIFMTKEEIDSFNLFKTNRETILYHLWVQKEAVLKAKGTGLQTLPTDIQGFVTPRANLRNEIINDFFVSTFQINSNIFAVSTVSKANVKFFLFEEM